MKKRSVLNSPRVNELKKKRRSVVRNRVIIILSIIVAILVGLSSLSGWDKANISDIKISGNKVVETSEIKAAVQERMAGKYLWIFPKTNFVFYPKRGIKSSLAEKFTRLKDISIGLTNTTTLEIVLSEREPAFSWCGLSPSDASDHKCYFMDSTGYIFDEAPYFSGAVYFKFFGGIKDADAPPGNYFSQNSFPKLVAFKGLLEGIGLKPTTLHIVGDGDIKVSLPGHTALSDGPDLLVKENADFSKVVENLQTALATEPFKTDFKKKYPFLVYIDLRFGDKVYYRFQ